MSRIFLAAPVIFCLLISCKPSGTEGLLAGADSLVITFNVPGSDSVLTTVSTTEKKAIRKLAGFMDGKERGKPGCGFGGNMIFYVQNRQLLPVVFHYDKDCRYFMYEKEQKLLYTEMSDEAADFLKSLAEGKNWY